MLLLRALQRVFQLLQARQEILEAAGWWQEIGQLFRSRMEAAAVLDSRQQGPAGSSGSSGSKCVRVSSRPAFVCPAPHLSALAAAEPVQL